MKIKGITCEDFLQYKEPSMFIATAFCTFKCEKECGIEGICQNSSLAKAPVIDMSVTDIIDLYETNDITRAVVFGGLEPFDQFEDIQCFLMNFRYRHEDDVVIYTGYTEDEVQDKLDILKLYENVIVKFGRFIPNQKPHYDEVLGIELASDNQYAKQVGVSC